MVLSLGEVIICPRAL